MKNWIKAFAIVVSLIGILFLLVFFVPYLMWTIIILALISSITFVVKVLLDEYGRKNN